MASILPPTPQGVPPGHPFWNQWYERLRVIINNLATSISWVNLNFTGSKLQDIVDRQHNVLQSLQGGSAGDYQHLTTSQKNTVVDVNTMLSFTNSGPVVISPTLASGGLQVLAGNTTSDGGALSFFSGNSSFEGNGGPISFQSGTSSGSGYIGGSLSFQGGTGSAVGGSADIRAGDSSDPGGSGGDLQLTAGNCPWTGGAGGKVFISSGIGELTSGEVIIQTPFGGTAIQVTDNGTSTLMGLFGATPVTRPATGGASAAFTVNSGTAINTGSTFDGYTIPQLVRALKNLGLLT